MMSHAKRMFFLTVDQSDLYVLLKVFTKQIQNKRSQSQYLQTHFRQVFNTYVNSDTLMMVKNGDFGVVCRNVSVKLLLVEVPLDAVEVIAFEIVVTFENGLVPFQSMRRDHGVRQKLHTDTTCKVEWRKKVTLTSIMSCREAFHFFQPFCQKSCHKFHQQRRRTFYKIFFVVPYMD